MKVVVAGSNGFIGSNAIDFFTVLGYEVIPLTRSDCDLTDSSSLKDFCKRHQPDLLLHAAVSLSDTNTNILMYYALEAAAQHCKRCIMIGSGAEYSHQRYTSKMPETYFSNESPPSNRDPYHISKYTISKLHEASATENIFNFRVFGIYGINEDYTRRLISNNIFQFLKTGTMSYNKNIAFDYLYVKDLFKAIDVFCNTASHNFRTYNVCSGRGDRFSDILSEVMLSLGGSTDQITCQDKSPTSYEYSGDCTRFESEYNHKIAQTSYRQASIEISTWLKSVIRQTPRN